VGEADWAFLAGSLTGGGGRRVTVSRMVTSYVKMGNTLIEDVMHRVLVQE
jgi:hypothetical protein